jgi:hypothetical protein
MAGVEEVGEEDGLAVKFFVDLPVWSVDLPVKRLMNLM